MFIEKISNLHIEDDKKNHWVSIPIADDQEDIQVTIGMNFFNLRTHSHYFTNVTISDEENKSIIINAPSPFEAVSKNNRDFTSMGMYYSPKIPAVPGNYMITVNLFDAHKQILDSQSTYFKLNKKSGDSNGKHWAKNYSYIR